jgi:hypothetical protein
MYTKNIALKARIESAGQMILPLRGRCMEPLLTAGDRVKIVPTTHFSKGRLYLFALPDGSVLVHRLIDKTYTYAIMKGDRSRCFETVPYRNIIGEVSAVGFADSENWYDIEKHKLTRFLISYVSKKSAMDKRVKSESALAKKVNRARSGFLVKFSYLTRKRWEKKRL